MIVVAMSHDVTQTIVRGLIYFILFATLFGWYIFGFVVAGKIIMAKNKGSNVDRAAAAGSIETSVSKGGE